ncbi:MAG: element excision factor XisH family protein [Spirochaetota bacterium]
MGAEKVLAAQKGVTEIAVEIKNFLGQSVIHDFYKALGQYILFYNFVHQKV